MFVIIQNSSLIFGPKNWSKLIFEEIIKEDCNLECNISVQNDENLPVVLDNDVKILPVVSINQPSYNSKIERLEGPYWNFYEDRAEMYYTVGDLPIDAVKNRLKNIISSNRYEYEKIGFDMKIQNADIYINTGRTERSVFLQTLFYMEDNETINWKFSEGWMQLTKPDMQQIVSKIKTHVQSCFIWEQNKIAEVDAANTLEELDAINTEVEI